MNEHSKKPGFVVSIAGTGRGALELVAALGGHLGPLPQAHDPATDPISLPPTVEGPRARAWLIDQEKLWALNPSGRRDAQVCNWVVEAPWAHPAWHSYWIALVHLRPFAGLAVPTRFYLEGATHEMWVFAMNPDHPRGQFVTGRAPPHHLTPMNFGAQLREDSDEAAAVRVEAAVHLIAEGKLNPDTDGSAGWVHLFGDNMLKGRQP